MKKIQNVTALFFILVVFVLAIVSIFGIWDFFNKDVITKSLQTLGLLAVVSIVILVSTNFIESRETNPEENALVIPNPIFKGIRKTTLVILIVFTSILAFLGILTIWDVIPNNNLLHKALGSLGVATFSAFLIVITCLEREGGSRFFKNKSFSIGKLVMVLILVYIVGLVVSVFR